MSDLFFRQVHPSWVGVNGELQSRSFVPTQKDKGLLSVDDSRRTSAEDSFKHFTETLGFQSAGTWAISTEEISQHEKLTCEASPLSINKLSEPAQFKKCPNTPKSRLTSSTRLRRSADLPH